eukprot:6442780-Ditylum_brightwellii.AAC.1
MKGDHTYYKTKITHPVVVQLGNFVRNQLPRLSARNNQGKLPERYQNSDDDSSNLSDLHLGTDNESAVTSESFAGKRKGQDGQRKMILSPGGKYCCSYNKKSC